LKQCARICIKLDLIAGNALFADGSKFRANAATHNCKSREHYEAKLVDIDRHIDDILNECEHLDAAEDQQESMVKMEKELENANVLKDKIKSAIQKFTELEKQKGIAPKTVNQTDPDCALMHSTHGFHASYNVQSVVDERHGLIVSVEAVNDTSDVNQFARQITQAEEVLEKPCYIASADAGYADTTELATIDIRGTTVIVPSQRQALHKPVDNPFDKSAFTFNREQNCYYCPEGQQLVYSGKSDGNLVYIISQASICHQCKNYGVCTEAQRGRSIMRLTNEDVREKLERQYNLPSSQKVYAKRKCRVEHPFGHMKQNLGIRSFLLRGQEGVQAESAIMATCFNIARMITILGGVVMLIARLTALNL